MAIYELPFSKGLCDGAGDNRMPYAYSTDLRNIRIVNQVSTVRKGYKTVVDDIVGTTIKGLASNNGNLYAIVDSKLKSCDLTNGNFTNIGSLPNDNEVNVITYGKYTILLNGNQPYVYDGTTLSAITSYVAGDDLPITFTGAGLNDLTIDTSANVDGEHHTYVVEIDGNGTPNTFKWNIDGGTYTTGVAITGARQELTNGVWIIFGATTGHTLADKWTLTQYTNSNPAFGTEFLNFTWVAGTGDRGNILYQSRPITATNQEYSYDWRNSGANQLIMKSNIQGLIATVSRLIIFTDKSIESIDRGSYITIGGVLNFYPNPIAQGIKLANNRSVVSAGERVFFLTADKKIKTIDYISGVDDLKVGDLSDDEKVGIPNFMNNLNDDLSGSIGFYDNKNKLIKFFVRSKNSTVNDICIIWDLVNKTFLVDDNKFYSILVNHDDKIYAGSCLNSMIYQDESGEDDDGGPISWYRYSAILSNGRPGKNKMYSGFSTSGTINSQTTITKDIILDGNIIDSSTISSPGMIVGGTASSQTAGIMTGGYTGEGILRNWTKNRGPEYINTIGRYLQTKYSGSGVGQNFTLETCETQEKLTNYEELSDK